MTTPSTDPETLRARAAAIEALAERCEKADGPDRELDAAIGVLIRWQPYGRTHWLAKYDREFFAFDDGFVKKLNSTDYRNEPLPGGGWEAPWFTSSLDTAMTLVPERWEFTTGRTHDGKGIASVWSPDHDEWTEEAASPALALCAAALRAHLQGTTDD